MKISEARGPIAIRFCLKQHLGGGGEASLGVGSELWFTWQQMSPLFYNGRNIVVTLAPSFLFFSACNKDNHKIMDVFDFGPDRTLHLEVTCSKTTKVFPMDL